jgi:cell division protease FtsH
MDEDQSKNQDGQDKKARPPRVWNAWIVLLVVTAVMMASFMLFNPNRSKIGYSYFKNLVEGKDRNGVQLKDENGKPIQTNIEEVELIDFTVHGRFIDPPPPEPIRGEDGKLIPIKEGAKLEKEFSVELPRNQESVNSLIETLTDKGINVRVNPQNDWLSTYASLLMFALMAGLLFMIFFVRRSQNPMMGGGGFLSNFAKSPAKKYEASDRPVTFKDVAGLESVKADLMEIVEYLQDPNKFQRLGGRVPKGVLLNGPPGTGKTLLARAVAGEADVPYFSVNGSEFIQMFVGVGASRVRDLFATAKAQSPAIIFIDEIDAVGRQRGAGLGGGHDEREQTLNQILGEMDGFDKTDSVIILAATNRPDILDPALLRPGRFDRHVTVSRPTKKGRHEIFKVHVREVPLGPDVDLEIMAQATAGMTGADIQNLVNEAALWAGRHNKTQVEMSDFYFAHDKVLMGAAREEVLTHEEKERTAYHESGHTLAAWYQELSPPVHKVTIIPRGRALGVTQIVPDEDRVSMSRQELNEHLVMLMAGRAAEWIIYKEMTVGAENDLERATSMARRMVTHWGMSQKLGPVSYKMSDEDPFLGREMQKSRQFSEHTMEVIDEEVHKILNKAASDANALLVKHREELETLTKALLDSEELDRKEIAELIGPSIHQQRKESKAKRIVKHAEQVVESNGLTSAHESESDAKPTGNDTTDTQNVSEANAD